MAGIIIQLLVSWLLVWLYNRKGLSVLGLRPTVYRLKCATLFFLLALCICAFGETLKAWFSPWRWVVNSEASMATLLRGYWWNIKSVLFEELIFRGVLLYILVRWLGWKSAGLLSAVAFGI